MQSFSKHKYLIHCWVNGTVGDARARVKKCRLIVGKCKLLLHFLFGLLQAQVQIEIQVQLEAQVQVEVQVQVQAQVEVEA